jgi:hypothetical protein
MYIKRTSLILIACFVLGLMSLSDSCKTSSVSQLTGVPMSLEIICDNPKEYLNKEIDLTGTFLGWSGANCNFVKDFAHQLTRSDWTFCDLETNCIYVTSGKPEFLDPLREEDLGVKIQLKARLMQDKEKKYYLKYIGSYKYTGNN